MSRPDQSDSETAAPVDVAPVPAPDAHPVTGALEWVDPDTVSSPRAVTGVIVAPDLLAGVRERKSRAALVPLGILVGLVGAYVAATLLWPTSALPPTLTAATVDSAAKPAAAPTWSADGAGAIAVGDLSTLASTSQEMPMASITKVITVMAVLEQHPLQPGEQGPTFDFTAADSQEYWDYLTKDESALDVPVDGSLTEYQMIEGILLGSAGNYTDRLAQWVWPDDEAYSAAAMDWLNRNGITGITVVEPTGIDSDNVATPDALIHLAKVAMANPVVAEIAAKQSADIPGAGLVENTNGIIKDPGVVGLKTGHLDGYNLLSVKDLPVGSETLRAYGVVLDQVDEAERDAASRALYQHAATAITPQLAVPKGTTVATVSTAWGATSTVETASDATVSLWVSPSTINRTVALTDDHTKHAAAGTLTVVADLGDATVDLRLAKELEGPSTWWRLTHPLELFGISAG